MGLRTTPVPHPSRKPRRTPLTRGPGYKQPGNWARLKAHIIKRDAGVCYICQQPGANTADHIIPVAEGGTHRVDNLAAAHEDPCHAAKTERERLAGLARHRQLMTRQRPSEQHPNSVIPHMG